MKHLLSIFFCIFLCNLFAACPGKLDPDITTPSDTPVSGTDTTGPTDTGEEDSTPDDTNTTKPDPDASATLPELGEPCKCATNSTPFTDCECKEGLRCFYNEELSAEPRCYQSCSVKADECPFLPEICPNNFFCFVAKVRVGESTTEVDVSICLDARRGAEKDKDDIEWANHACVNKPVSDTFSDDSIQLCPNGYFCQNTDNDDAGTCTQVCIENSEEFSCPDNKPCISAQSSACGFCFGS